MNISSYGSIGGGQFDPSQMKAQFDKMKESVRSSNPEMAKKMDAFESKMDEAQKSGKSLSQDDIKSYAKQAGLPDLGGAEGSQGGSPFGQSFQSGDSSADSFLKLLTQSQNDSYSSYDSKGQGAKNNHSHQFQVSFSA